MCWALLGFAACRRIPAQAEAPAVLTNPTRESRASLVQAVSKAIPGGPVTLADDALTRTDTLIIEHVSPRGPDGLPIEGRERGSPERFRLVRIGSDCVLVHLRTEKHYVLAHVTCSLL
jgi:hypothetical protein